MTIRAAKNSDGLAIQAILSAQDRESSRFDFTEIEPWWIVYERNGEILGCAFFVPSRPVAYMDDFAVRPDKMLKGIGARLYWACRAAAVKAGCQALRGPIEEDNLVHRHHAMKRGAVDLGLHRVYQERLKERGTEKDES